MNLYIFWVIYSFKPVTCGVVVGSEKHPWFFSHICEASSGYNRSVQSATFWAQSVTYTGGQKREDSSRSRWSRALSLRTIYFEPQTTWPETRHQLICTQQHHTPAGYNTESCVPDEDTLYWFCLPSWALVADGPSRVRFVFVNTAETPTPAARPVKPNHKPILYMFYMLLWVDTIK